MKGRVLKISGLTFDKELYPRMETNWMTAYSYSQAMRSGEVFPPIIVGSFEGKLYVVDGWHRVEAKKMLKEQYVQGIVKDYNDKKTLFLDAIKYNISHGKPLSSQEKVRLIYKLKEEMGFDVAQIIGIVKVPMDKIELFKARVLTGVDGKPIFLKSVVARSRASDEAKRAVNQDVLGSFNVVGLLSQLIELLESGVLDVDDEAIKPLAVKILGLLQMKLGLKVEA